MESVKKPRNSTLFYVCYYGLLVILLQVFLTIFNVPSFVFPKPFFVAKVFFLHFGYLFSNGVITLMQTILGILFASFLSIVLGALFVYYKRTYRYLFPFILIFQMLPIVAIGPIIIIWFGFGISAKILVVMLFSLYPILASFLDGARGVQKELLQWMTLIRATRFQIFRYVLFPFCMSNFFSGLKIAVTYGITSSIVAEILGSEKGLGVCLSGAIASFNIGLLFSIVIFIVVASLLLYKTVLYIELKTKRRG